jgi:hypothetical protein
MLGINEAKVCYHCYRINTILSVHFLAYLNAFFVVLRAFAIITLLSEDLSHAIHNGGSVNAPFSLYFLIYL